MALTDRTFWENYWKNRKGVVKKVTTKDAFSKVFTDIIEKIKPESALELGGFPGYISIALKKNHNIQKVALLDYYIYLPVVEDLLAVNELAPSDVKMIEADLFSEYSDEKYTLVHSHGLIEHFEDTKGIIYEHLKYLDNGGGLLITLPNFRGINGWCQRKFDEDNYSKHYIDSMRIPVLLEACEQLGLKDVRVSYYGRFTIWLENMNEKSKLFAFGFRVFWFVFKVFNVIIPLRNRWLSPYILITARK